MAYLILILFRSPLLKTLSHLYHGLVPTSLCVYAPAQVIKTQQGMPKEVANLIETYITNQGMSS